jgi:hypothetical protein
LKVKLNENKTTIESAGTMMAIRAYWSDTMIGATQGYTYQIFVANDSGIEDATPAVTKSAEFPNNGGLEALETYKIGVFKVKNDRIELSWLNASTDCENVVPEIDAGYSGANENAKCKLEEYKFDKSKNAFTKSQGSSIIGNQIFIKFGLDN